MVQSNTALNIQENIQPILKRIPTKRKPRKINPEKIKALAFAGVSTGDIAKHQGVDNSTVWRFLKHNDIEVKDLKYYTEHRSEVLKAIQCNDLELHNRIVKGLLDQSQEYINALPSQAKIGLINVINNSFGTKFDKERLEEGKSTSNIFYADMVKAREQVIKQIDELEK